MRNMIVLLLLCCNMAGAQGTDSSKLNVFIDCRTGCDLQFIRTEIQLVNFVMDRTAADVHVLLTAQGVGSGGAQYQLELHGQNRFAAHTDTLRFVTGPTATGAEVRQQLLHHLMLGLTPLLAKTSAASGITLSMKDKTMDRPVAQAPTTDKWNYWVFRVGAHGELSADQVYNTNLLNAHISANRTTDKLKIEFYVYGSRRHSQFALDGGRSESKYTVKNSDYGVFNDVVKTLSPHWSYGFQLDYSNNTFNNMRSKIYFNPALEYNIFNFKEINNRSFVLRYGVEVHANRYYDTTIYNEIAERLYGQRFTAALTFNKTWGSFSPASATAAISTTWSSTAWASTSTLMCALPAGFRFLYMPTPAWCTTRSVW